MYKANAVAKFAAACLNLQVRSLWTYSYLIFCLLWESLDGQNDPTPPSRNNPLTSILHQDSFGFILYFQQQGALIPMCIKGGKLIFEGSRLKLILAFYFSSYRDGKLK